MLDSVARVLNDDVEWEAVVVAVAVAVGVAVAVAVGVDVDVDVAVVVVVACGLLPDGTVGDSSHGEEAVDRGCGRSAEGRASGSRDEIAYELEEGGNEDSPSEEDRTDIRHRGRRWCHSHKAAAVGQYRGQVAAAAAADRA